MLRLYFAPLTRSIRIKWLLEELGLEHEIIPRQSDRVAPYAGQDTPSGRYRYLNALKSRPALAEGRS